MGLIIDDGLGRGRSASVDSDNRLGVNAVTQSTEHYVNHISGLAFNCVFSQSPDDDGDCIFYMKNTNDTSMVVEGITFGCKDATADDSLYFKLGDAGTRNSASALTPVNVNSGSGETATGDFEKGANLNDGTLTGGLEFERIIIPGASIDVGSKSFNFPQDVVLAKNGTFTIWIDGSGTGTYYITVHFNYHGTKQ